MKNNFASLIVLVVFFLAGFFIVSKYKSNPSLALPLSREGAGEVSPPDKGDIGGLKSVKIGGQNVQVDLALTSAEQAQGLSGRASLAENQGMLFVFPQPGQYLFWMKDMKFSIDMIWFSADLKVIYIKKEASPESYLPAGKAGPETYGPAPSDGQAKYVLEVPAGFADKNNLQIGDSVQFTY